MIIETLMVVILLMCCLYASYTDIRRKKISNFCTFSMICLGTSFQFYFLLQGEIIFPQLLERILGGFVVAILMYLTSIWGAGDSKFFWGILVMLPPYVFSTIGEAQSPLLILVVNIFVPHFLYMIVLLILKNPIKEKHGMLSEVLKSLKPKEIFFYLLDAFYLIGISSLIFMFFNQIGYQGHLSKVIALLSVLIFNQSIEKYRFQNFKRYILSPLAIVLMFTHAPPLHFIITLFSFFLFLKFFFKPFIHGLGQHLFVTELSIYDLQESMIPVEMIRLKKRKDGKIECQVRPTALFMSPMTESGEEVLFDIGRQGLSKEKIDQLKDLASSGWFEPFDNKIKIQQQMAFAPVMFFGTLLTLVCKGAFYQILM